MLYSEIHCLFEPLKDLLIGNEGQNVKNGMVNFRDNLKNGLYKCRSVYHTLKEEQSEKGKDLVSLLWVRIGSKSVANKISEGAEYSYRNTHRRCTGGKVLRNTTLIEAGTEGSTNLPVNCKS